MLITLPLPKFNEIGNKLELCNIPEGYVTSIIIIDNKKYVATGGCGDGKCEWAYFWIYEIVPIEDYKGELKPLNYSDHTDEVTLGNRERAYTGISVKFEGVQYVFIGEGITVKCNDSEKQLKLF